MTIIEAMAIGAAWAALAFFAAAAFAGKKDPEQQTRDDDAQWRWILESQFIRHLDEAGERYGHSLAWQIALKATGQASRNITRWPERHLQLAIRAFKEENHR